MKSVLVFYLLIGGIWTPGSVAPGLDTLSKQDRYPMQSVQLDTEVACAYARERILANKDAIMQSPFFSDMFGKDTMQGTVRDFRVECVAPADPVVKHRTS